MDEKLFKNSVLQMSIFGFMYPHYKITKPIRLIELFAGYGSQALALKYLQEPFEHHAICEFDRYAVQAYNEIHGTNFKTSDIRNITANDLNITDPGSFTYLLTYSFPCQDLSLAGKGKGMSKGSNTRSGLLWEVERLLKECKQNLPQVLLMENVPEVIGQKNIDDFNQWQLSLESLGYKNYFKLLNAKDFGIPQNRNRCFMISLLGDFNYEFPKSISLQLRLKDLLENDFDDKYYLSDKMLNYFYDNDKKQKLMGNGFSFKPSDGNNIARGIKTRAGSRMDNNFILVPEATKKGYAKADDGDGIYINRPHQKRGTVQKGMTPTIKCGVHDIAVVCQKNKKLRIRKLTPKECFRLMGVKDDDYDKITVSNSQKYKLAGNSIVVNVLMAIFKQLF